jgi:Ni2+-binding GTPase involved in maturation of urease and hydrogenase
VIWSLLLERKDEFILISSVGSGKSSLLLGLLGEMNKTAFENLFLIKVEMYQLLEALHIAHNKLGSKMQS